MKHTKYTNINRRVRELTRLGYLKEAGVKTVKAGFQTSLYQMNTKAYLAILLNELNLDDFIENISEQNALAILAVFFKS